MNRKNDHDPGLRGWLNRNPMIAAVAGAVVLVGAATVLAMTLKSPSKVLSGVYYYDLNTGETFTASSGQITPIIAPSNEVTDDPSSFTGVLAHVFACGDCSNEADHFVGYLEAHNAAQVTKLRQRPSYTGEEVTDALIVSWLRDTPQGILIRDPNGNDTWYARNSNQADAIRRRVKDNCASDKPIECRP